MAVAEQLTDVTVVSGDHAIAHILKEAALVNPTFACHYDGFVNDVSSEYANPSILRPRSVRKAQLSSELSAYFYLEDADAEAAAQPPPADELFDFQTIRTLPVAGDYYLGWTMYDNADAEENITAWVGANKVAYVRTPDNDNRVHLYVLNQSFFLDEGERLRLVTDANDSPYRLENIVLLHTLPKPSARQLSITDIAAEIDEGTAGKGAIRLNWRSSRPAQCRVAYGEGDEEIGAVAEEMLLANHSITLSGITTLAAAWFVISGHSRAGESVMTSRLRLPEYLPAGAGVTQVGSIPFTVTNQLATPVHASPITWGLPFPRGVLWDLEHCRLIGPDGALLPTQRRVQVAWDDGSVRWALFDFQLDLPAAGAKQLRLDYGPDVQDEPVQDGIQVTTLADGVLIDTGVLRLRISKEHYVFPAVIERKQGDEFKPIIGAQKGKGAITLMSASGEQFTVDGTLDELDLEEAGPLRATLRLAVKHRLPTGESLFRSVMRVSAYAGQPFVRVQHTFENDNVDQLFTQIRSLTLHANLAEDWLDQLWLGGARVSHSNRPVRLLQSFADHFQVWQGDELIGQGEHADNRLLVSGGAGVAAVGMRDFWENYPKGWGADADGIHIDICPDISTVTYPQGDLEEVRSYFYLQEGQYKFKRGMARTHDMLWVFASNEAETLSKLDQFSTPPLVRIEPELLTRTGVVSALCPRETPGAEQYDAWCDEALNIYEQDRAATQAVGMLNFGDWYGERRYNWGNSEYDTPYGFLLEYLRGGSGRYFTLGWQGAWHVADVDTCHYHTDPMKSGLQYLHALGHVGDYYADASLAGTIAREMVDWSHTWVEGLYLYALLTGERRLWEAATRTATILAGAELNDYDFTNCRDCGWPLRHLIGAYQATGRKVFLNGASIIVERVLERQRPTGGWERLMVPGHCFHVPPRHMGNAGFMVGVLLAALKRYHEETQQTEVGDAIVAAARYLMQSMWEPKHDAFRYTSCPASKTAGELNAQILEGLGYAWRLSGDAELRSALVAGLAACLTTPHNSTTPPDGKDISSRMRSMPFIMHDVVNVENALE